MSTVNTSNVLRAAVLSSYDGIVSNLGVVVGVGMAGVDAVIPALAALLGGALSMSTGEFVSVWAQNESLDDDEVSPWCAAGASVITFALCGLVPLAGWLVGGVPGALLAGLACLMVVGAAVSRFTQRTALNLIGRLVMIGVGAGTIALGFGSLLG